MLHFAKLSFLWVIGGPYQKSIYFE